MDQEPCDWHPNRPLSLVVATRRRNCSTMSNKFKFAALTAAFALIGSATPALAQDVSFELWTKEGEADGSLQWNQKLVDDYMAVIFWDVESIALTEQALQGGDIDDSGCFFFVPVHIPTSVSSTDRNVSIFSRQCSAICFL